MAKAPDKVLRPIQGRRVYGRRLSRPLNLSRSHAMETLFPLLSLEPDAITGQKDVDPRGFFKDQTAPVWFEIGFGGGEHLKALMEKHPEINFIGAEPYINGMAGFLKSLEGMETSHLRVWMDDAITLASTLRDASIARLYVLNPDPWPKKKHHKRRIINQANLDIFARILEPGGLLYMATDVAAMAEWMLDQTLNHGAFEWTARGKDDWQNPPPGWPLITRYAQKGLEAGRSQSYFIFQRKP